MASSGLMLKLPDCLVAALLAVTSRFHRRLPRFARSQRLFTCRSGAIAAIFDRIRAEAVAPTHTNIQ
jgi:hypothetical protein